MTARNRGILIPMSVNTALSVEEYLHTSFPDLDREYRDGELVERISSANPAHTQSG